MSTYKPSFITDTNVRQCIDKINEEEKNIMTPIDMSRLTSSWLQNVFMYINSQKKKENSRNAVYYNAYRDNPRVPTSNLF